MILSQFAKINSMYVFAFYGALFYLSMIQGPIHMIGIDPSKARSESIAVSFVPDA